MAQTDVALSEALLEFAQTLSTGQDVADVLRDLAGKLANALDIEGPGVCLLENGAVHAVSGLGRVIPLAPRDRPASRSSEEMTRSGRLVLIRRTDEEGFDWSACAAKIAALGFEAVDTVPIGEDATPAAIELYTRSDREWTPAELVVVHLFAEVATAYLQHATELERERRTVEQLQRALTTRIVIEQAKGMIAAQRDVTVDRAFVLLRKHANDHNASLHSVAEAVVNLGLRLGPR